MLQLKRIQLVAKATFLIVIKFNFSSNIYILLCCSFMSINKIILIVLVKVIALVYFCSGVCSAGRARAAHSEVVLAACGERSSGSERNRPGEPLQ